MIRSPETGSIQEWRWRRTTNANAAQTGPVAGELAGGRASAGRTGFSEKAEEPHCPPFQCARSSIRASTRGGPALKGARAGQQRLSDREGNSRNPTQTAPESRVGMKVKPFVFYFALGPSDSLSIVNSPQIDSATQTGAPLLLRVVMMLQCTQLIDHMLSLCLELALIGIIAFCPLINHVLMRVDEPIS